MATKYVIKTEHGYVADPYKTISLYSEKTDKALTFDFMSLAELWAMAYKMIYKVSKVEAIDA